MAVAAGGMSGGDSHHLEDHRIGQRFLTLMGGRFTRDTMIYIAGTLAVGPFSLVSVVVLTRLMVPAQYGEMAVLMVFAGYLTVLYNTGSLHGTFMWVYGASEGEGDDVDSDATITSTPRRALGTGVALTLMIVTAGTAVFCVLAPVIARLLLLHGSGAALVRWAAFSAAAGALWRLTVNVFRMERRPARFAAFNALRPLFVVGGTVPLVALGFGVQGALAGTALGTLAATATCMALAWRSYALAFCWADAREIMRRGGMVVVPVLCLFIVHSADVVLLSHFAPPREVGIYRIASRFAAVPSYFASAFLMAWSPLERGVLFQGTYRHLGEGRVRGSILTYYLVAATTIVVLLDVTSGGLVLLAGRAYRSAAPLIPLIGVGFVCYGLFIVLVRTVKVQRRMLLYSGGAVIAVLLEIALSLVTIPWLGAYGVPVAMIGGLLIASLLWIAVAKGLMHASLNFQVRPLAGLAGAVATTAIVQAVGLHLWPAGRPLVLIVALVSYLTALVAFGAVPRRHLKPLSGLARAAVRNGVGGQDPTLGLGHLDSGQRSLLVAIERDNTPIVVLTERLGRSERELCREYTMILRKLIGARPAAPELDERLGRYLLSREPEAQRDLVAHKAIEEGADAFELMELNEAAQKLRSLSAGLGGVESQGSRRRAPGAAGDADRAPRRPARAPPARRRDRPARRAHAGADRHRDRPLGADRRCASRQGAAQGQPARQRRPARRGHRHGTARLAPRLPAPTGGPSGGAGLRSGAQAPPLAVARSWRGQQLIEQPVDVGGIDGHVACAQW